MVEFIRNYFAAATIIPERIYLAYGSRNVYTDRECGMYAVNPHDWDITLSRAEVIEILINA